MLKSVTFLLSPLGTRASILSQAPWRLWERRRGASRRVEETNPCQGTKKPRSNPAMAPWSQPCFTSRVPTPLVLGVWWMAWDKHPKRPVVECFLFGVAQVLSSSQQREQRRDKSSRLPVSQLVSLVSQSATEHSSLPRHFWRMMWCSWVWVGFECYETQTREAKFLLWSEWIFDKL